MNMRLVDWDQRLVAVIAEHQSRPFAWGEADCAALFAAAVAAVTGRDPLAAFRPWASEHDALRRLAGTGAPSVVAWVAERFDEIVPADARRGDVGYAAEAEMLSFPAIIVGALAMSRNAEGWIIIPRARIVRAFKVG